MRVGVLGEVMHLPDFGGVQSRVLGNRIGPPHRDRIPGLVERAELSRNGTVKARKRAGFLVE